MFLFNWYNHWVYIIDELYIGYKVKKNINQYNIIIDDNNDDEDDFYFHQK